MLLLLEDALRRLRLEQLTVLVGEAFGAPLRRSIVVVVGRRVRRTQLLSTLVTHVALFFVFIVVLELLLYMHESIFF